MGLDILVMPKPKAGFEEEFRNIFLRIQIAQGLRKNPRPQSFWARLTNKPEPIEPLELRFDEISDPHFELLGAPVVGRDAKADDWLREQVLAQPNANEVSVEQTLKETAGLHVLDLLPECDGFPVYSHGGFYEGVDRTSFRGAFLEIAKPALDKTLLHQAWNSMLADELMEWGNALKAAAKTYAEAHGVESILDQRAPPMPVDDTDSSKNPPATPAECAHIIESAARWALYWSARGHGSEAYF